MQLSLFTQSPHKGQPSCSAHTTWAPARMHPTENEVEEAATLIAKWWRIWIEIRRGIVPPQSLPRMRFTHNEIEDAATLIAKWWRELKSKQSGRKRGLSSLQAEEEFEPVAARSRAKVQAEEKGGAGGCLIC